jgi:hypothetical protein
MADDARTTGFWRTMPGILTGVAGLVTAVAGLVVALTQAGIVGSRGAAPNASSGSPPAALDGRWHARVSYPWGVTKDEVFTFRVEGGRVLGTATYLGVPRAIEGGAVDGARVEFSTRAEEFSGTERRTYENRYDGLVSARGIQFELRDSRGNAPTEFTARRTQ